MGTCEIPSAEDTLARLQALPKEEHEFTDDRYGAHCRLNAHCLQGNGLVHVSVTVGYPELEKRDPIRHPTVQNTYSLSVAEARRLARYLLELAEYAEETPA